MILGHLQNKFVVINVFLVFFKGSSRIFFLSTYAESCTFLWHHTLNQHIHIDTMYTSGITHFNTMILISLCENCKLHTYWYRLVWVFIFLPQYPYCHGIQILKKAKYPYQMGMLKIQYQSNSGPNHLRHHDSNIGQIIQYFNIRKMVNNSQHCKNMANHENPQHDLNISHLCYLQFRLLLWQENAWHARNTSTWQCTTKPQFLWQQPPWFCWSMNM